MSTPKAFAAVSPLAVPVDRTYDYAIPQALIGRVLPGDMVAVPFKNRQIFAVVMKLLDKPEVPAVKEIVSRVDDFRTFPPDLMHLCIWISKVFVCSMRSVMDTVFPFQKSMRQRGFEATAYAQLKRQLVQLKIVNLRDEVVGSGVLDDFEAFKRAPSRRRVLQTLLAAGGSLPMKELLDKANVTIAPVNALEQLGCVAIDYVPRSLSPAGTADSIEKLHILTPEQDAAFQQILKCIDGGCHGHFLLQGITGSGKTEIYMHAAAEAIKRGKTVLVLVPEIALSTQIIQRFLRKYIGHLAVWHSMLSLTERLYEWERVASGKVDIVIGARSAVFAPLRDLGLVIVDEEQEASYKQESHPRYHGREAAIERARAAGCPVVLGTATPSVEMVYRAKRGKATVLSLTERIGESELPEIVLVDMKRVLRRKTTSTFSPQLLGALKANLDRGEQSLVFLNHRGYAQFVQCFRCGTSLVCPDCSVAMKYHKESNSMSCHICGHGEGMAEKCPDCGSRALRLHGIGTEKVFNQLQKHFPNANIERMDRDTTSRRGEYRRIISAMENGEIDILVGTQMIAKGLDFSGVTLVGVVSADSIVNMPDFRSSERTFQLLTQVAGRSGRRETPGKVIVQTLSPKHPAVVHACAHEFEPFYEYELNMRRLGRFPPYTRMANCIVASPDQDEAKALAEKLYGHFRAEIELLNSSNYLGLLGPAEAPLFKLHAKYRWFVGARAASLVELVRVVSRATGRLTRDEQRLVSIDVMPVNMM